MRALIARLRSSIQEANVFGQFAFDLELLAALHALRAQLCERCACSLSTVLYKKRLINKIS